MKIKTFYLLCAALLFLMPSLGIVLILLDEGNKQVAFAEKERTGITYHRALFDVQIAFQRFRGESFIVANTNAPLTLLAETKINVENALRAADAAIVHSKENGFTINEEWAGARSAIQKALHNKAHATPTENFSSHTHILSQLGNIMREVGDQSNLILDPELPSYYMMNLMVNVLPEGIEHIAHSRSLLSGLMAKGHFTHSATHPMIINQGKLQDFVAEYHYALSVLEKTMPEKNWQEITGQDHSLGMLEAFEALSLKAAMQKTAEGRYPGYEEVFAKGTETIAVFKLGYDNLSETLDGYLAHRIHKELNEWWLSLIGGIIAAAMAVLVFFSAYRGMKRSGEIEKTKRLKESEERFNLAVAGTNDGIWDWVDVNKDEVYWSPQFKSLLGYADHELQAGYKEFFSLLHPDDIAPLNKHLMEHFEQNAPFNTEYRLKKKNGEYCWFRAKATSVRDAGGKPQRMVGSIRDISKRKESDRIIKEREARTRAILDYSLDGIITTDVHGVIQSYNAACEEIFQYKAEEAVGQNLTILMPEPDHSAHDNYIQHYVQTGRAKVIGIGREVVGKRKNGEVFPLELAISEIRMEDGYRIFSGVVRDITQRKASDAKLHEYATTMECKSLELAEAKEQAEEATRLKSEFLANMSHEIRTPMNGVIGMTNLLLDTKLDDIQRQYANIVASSADNLLQLVNDILDFSKIEAGRLELEIIPFDIQQLMEEVADLLAIKAQEKGVEVLLRFAPNTPRFVKGDPGRIRQVFLNLAGNALKFTEAGHVLLSLESKGTEDGFASYYATIEDTGIGIPEDKIGYIFNKFTQADSSTTRKFGGTGLGLAICKELTRKMGGDVGAASQVGIGSTFWFTLKLELDADCETRETLNFESDLTGVRGLVVDDNKVAQKIASEQMLARGMAVDTASTPYEALEKLHMAAGRGEPYHMAVLDYMMPEMDGIALATIIKSDTAIADICLLMVSSAPSRGDSSKMGKIGFAGFLTKPVNSADIASALSAIWRAKQDNKEIPLVTRHSLHEASSIKREKTRETIRLDGIQILLVEDNATNQMVATAMLEKYGCHITPAGNGKEALRLAKQHRFDLIFMDCQMPEMDGYEATEAIRAVEKRGGAKRTPIIAFTANAMKGDAEKCINAGMDGYISKPVKQDELEDILLEWLKPNERKSKTDVRENAHDNDNTILNKNTFTQLKTLLGNQFDTIIEKYLLTSQSYIEQLEKAAEQNNTKMLADAAHPLKSSSNQIGAEMIASIAKEVEHMAKNGQEANYVELVNQLHPAFDELKKQIGSIG